MIKLEILLLWITVGLYALSSCIYLYSLAFHRPGALRGATLVAVTGLVLQAAALALRWVEAGHGPYMRRYEVYSSDVFILVLMFLVVQRWRPSLRALGGLVMPASFLMIGMAVLASPEIRALPTVFKTYWLLVHIFFAKLAYGAALIGTALAVLFLLKQRQQRLDRLTPFYRRLPDLAMLDELSYGFLGFGFLMLGIMIMAGSIWAKTAWGAYWGWDAVETWSLISWLVYGIYLHLRRTYGWRGARAAWFSLLAFGVLVFALFGVGVVYNSVHSPYVGG